MDSPIFIGGLERSGKSYLRMMLGGHPRLFFSRRTNLWTRYYNRYDDLNERENLERCLGDLLKSKHTRALIADPFELRQELVTGTVSYGRLFALIHEGHARKIGKPRWGDQTEFLERCADVIFAAFPHARFIQLLRDPRDRYEAMLHKSGRRGGPGVAVTRWRNSAELAIRNEREYPGRYKVVRYEDMVKEPESTLKGVCDFLGEQYFPDMLRMQGEARFADLNLQDDEEATGPLTTKYIGSFRSGLSGRETAYIQRHAGQLMTRFGYSSEPVRFSWSESLRFHLLDETVHSLHRIGWQLRTRGRA